MPLLRYRYYQPTDGRYHYADMASSEEPAYRLVYSGGLPATAEPVPEDVLERLLDRHACAMRPEGGAFRPAGTGDMFDLGPLGLWQVLPIGFRTVDTCKLRVETAA